MRLPKRALSARTFLLAVVVALAIAVAGPGHGSSDDGDSTRGAETAQPAPPGAGPVPETTNLQPKRGTKPSKTVPNRSTRDMRAPANRNSDSKGKSTAVVDKTDRGVKNLPATKDRGKKNAPVTRDRGAR